MIFFLLSTLLIVLYFGFIFIFILKFKKLNIYTIHKVIPPITLAPIWHYTQPLQ